MNTFLKSTLAAALVAGSAYGVAYAEQGDSGTSGDNEDSTLGETYMEMQQGEQEEIMGMLTDMEPMQTMSASQIDVWVVTDGSDGRIKVFSYLDENGNRVILDRVRLPN